MKTRLIKHEVWRERPYATGPEGQDWSQSISCYISLPYGGADLRVMSLEYIIEQDQEETNQLVLPCIKLLKRIYGWVTIIPALSSEEDCLSKFVEKHYKFLTLGCPFDVSYVDNYEDKKEKLLGVSLVESCGFGIYKFVARTYVNIPKRK